MKMYYLLLRTGLLNLLIILLFGCASNSVARLNSSKQTKPSYKEIAEKKFGENVAYKYNNDRSFVLCEKIIKEPKINPNQSLEFLVIDIKGNNVVFRDKIVNAKVEWNSRTHILITKHRGYITDKDDDGKWSYIIDVITNEKTIKNEIIIKNQ